MHVHLQFLIIHIWCPKPFHEQIALCSFCVAMKCIKISSKNKDPVESVDFLTVHELVFVNREIRAVAVRVYFQQSVLLFVLPTGKKKKKPYVRPYYAC